MLTLIKREITDMVVLFLIGAVFLIIMITGMTSQIALNWEKGPVLGISSVMVETTMTLIFLSLAAAAALGASQMHFDHDKNISSFLATLAVTRRRILFAKIITGILWHLFVFGTVALADLILLKAFPKASLPDIGFLIRMITVLFLCSFACYSFGLMIGWGSSKWLAALGIILVLPILISLVVIKGFSMQAAGLFLLFIVAAIVRTWQKFMSASL